MSQRPSPRPRSAELPDAYLLDVDGAHTHYHDTGDGADNGVPTLLLHGSGPGVSAWANWRAIMPGLRKRRRLIAPDQLGFARTATGEGRQYGRAVWTGHALRLMDTLRIDRFDVIGNSLGGAIALSLAVARPDAVRRLVLMGTMGTAMELPPGLNQVWGYTPSLAGMRELIRLFAHDQSIVTDELVRLRYEASLEGTTRASWEAMFPPPRQRWVDDLVLGDDELASIEAPVLLVHGRDDRVVPWHQTSLPLVDKLANVRLHVFGQCGHWTMIERAEEFVALVDDFLAHH